MRYSLYHVYEEPGDCHAVLIHCFKKSIDALTTHMAQFGGGPAIKDEVRTLPYARSEIPEEEGPVSLEEIAEMRSSYERKVKALRAEALARTSYFSDYTR